MHNIKENFIEQYIKNLTYEYPSIESIWLIGSRANGCEKKNSDWDLLIFANKNILESLKTNTKFNSSQIDLLIVFDGKNFQEPWHRANEKNIYKQGSLPGWNWKIIDQDNATYKSDIGLRNVKKNNKNNDLLVEYTPEEKEFRAKKIWPKIKKHNNFMQRTQKLALLSL